MCLQPSVSTDRELLEPSAATAFLRLIVSESSASVQVFSHTGLNS